MQIKAVYFAKTKTPSPNLALALALALNLALAPAPALTPTNQFFEDWLIAFSVKSTYYNSFSVFSTVLYKILKVADKQKRARALIIISESRDDPRKTQKYLKINRWVGTLQNPKIRELSEFEEFNGQMIKHANLFEMQRNNSGYLKTAWSL